MLLPAGDNNGDSTVRLVGLEFFRQTVTIHHVPSGDGLTICLLVTGTLRTTLLDEEAILKRAELRIIMIVGKGDL
jgi:hypothetical protein